MNFPNTTQWLTDLEAEIVQTTNYHLFGLARRPVQDPNNPVWCSSSVRCEYLATYIELLIITKTGILALSGKDRTVFQGLIDRYTVKMSKRIELANELTEHNVFNELNYLTICNNSKVCFEYFKNLCIYGQNNA
jgi:hypothetical protein